MKIKEANKKNQFANDGQDGHQQERIVLANHRRRDAKYLQVFKSNRSDTNNERLEFLGDAVLSAVVAIDAR